MAGAARFAPAADPAATEKAMLAAFAANVPAAVARASCDPGLVLPYANLMQPGGRRKQHGITGVREERRPSRLRERRTASPALPRTSPAIRPAAYGLDAINDAIQRRMRARGDRCVTAVDAASWLDAEGLLKDSATRPGLPLRRLLRAGRILGQRQEGERFWFIDRKA